MHRLKTVCKGKNILVQVHRWPILSVLFKSSKIDFTVQTNDVVYLVRFLTSFSNKKVLHFVDERNYVSYLKTFTALPMATKVSEHINFASFHRLPASKKEHSDVANQIYVLLFNPTPNNITCLVNGTMTEIGNGSPIGKLVAYNGKGFCAMLDQRDCT